MDFEDPPGHHRVHDTTGSIVFRKYLIHCLAIVLILSLGSCKQDVQVREDSLYGKWEIIKASRNGKETQYLRGGYFVFQSDGMMIVNITGSEEKGTFELDGQQIDFNQEKVFDIMSFHRDTLGVRYPLSATSLFEFYLARKKDETK